ncbi:MAG: acetyl-CoA C-acetyltransferase [Anaerolineales bacterium]|nr:MAG: acetyl-CoA C-acetyltransferase [Anaerolineales bacterium]
MPEAVILSAVRTPIGAHRGSLAQVRPDDLAALVIAEAVQRAGIPPAEIEEVYLGCTNQAGEDNRNVARMATLLAGLPVEVAAVTFNRLCASSLHAVNAAYRAIKAGEGDLFVAGGVESMSRAPYSLAKPEQSFPWGNQTLWDTTLGWRYPNPRLREQYGNDSMGETAENVAELYPQITRQQQDAFALESHRRALAAIDDGRMADEILPVEIPQRKGDPIRVDTDERPRRDTSEAALARLKPAFRPDGTVTAGNASGINDGAAALVIASAAKARALGLVPWARILASAAAGVAPRTMGLGPIAAITKALQRAGLSVDDLGLIELNEAFAVQSLAVMQALGLPHERTNVNGGAIALGHPLGCSGARILTTLVHEMRRRAPGEGRPYYGLAALCVGVGQGEATIIEWLGEASEA